MLENIKLSELDLKNHNLTVIKEPYISFDESQKLKQKTRFDMKSLSGSKIKQILENPVERYWEVINKKEPIFDQQSQIRMKWGNDIETFFIYNRVKVELENNQFWDNKIIIIDKRRRYVKEMPWISYEIDAIVYQLEQPRVNYTMRDNKTPLKFIIDNTNGFYDEFLSTQEKYAIYDVKVSQVDIERNYLNYIYQLHLYAFWEKCPRAGLFNNYQAYDFQHLCKDIDFKVITKMFLGYDDFIEKALTNQFVNIDRNINNKVIEIKNSNLNLNIKKAINMLFKLGIKEKNLEFQTNILKEYIKDSFSKMHPAYKLKIEKEEGTFIASKTYSTLKETFNSSELQKFLLNNNITKFISKDNHEFNFNMADFVSIKSSGGFSKIAITPNEKPQLTKELQKIKEQLYEF